MIAYQSLLEFAPASPSLRLSWEDIKSGKLLDIDLNNAGVISDHYYILPRLSKNTTYGRLPVRAKILYAILLDMMQLSLKYGNHIDTMGAWCSMDTDMAQSALQCGHSTLTNCSRSTLIVCESTRTSRIA